MMAQIHVDAVRESRIGGPQYILKRGAYLVRCRKNLQLLDVLREGYCLEEKYVNGVAERNWEVADSRYPEYVADCIARVLSCDTIRQCAWSVRICTQEFFNKQVTERECIWMYLTMQQEGKTQTLWVTPKDKSADPEGYTAGQIKANAIVDILQHFGCRQSSERLITELEKELHEKAQKSFIDDVINAVHNTFGVCDHALWTDTCVEIPVPESIATGFKLVVWGEENEELYYSITLFWNDMRDSYSTHACVDCDSDLDAAVKAALERLLEIIHGKK